MAFSKVLLILSMLIVLHGDIIWQFSDGIDSNWNNLGVDKGDVSDCVSCGDTANCQCEFCNVPPKCLRLKAIAGGGGTNTISTTRTTSITDYTNIKIQFYAYHNGASGDGQRYCKFIYQCNGETGEIDFLSRGTGIRVYSTSLTQCDKSDAFITTFECTGGTRDWFNNNWAAAWIDDVILSGNRITSNETDSNTVTSYLQITLSGITPSLFAALNGSMDQIEVILNNLYLFANITEIESLEITNAHELSLTNDDQLSIDFTVTYPSIYGDQIMNYSLSNRYGDGIVTEIKDVYNETVSVDVEEVEEVSQYFDFLTFINYADTMTLSIIAIMAMAVVLALIAFLLNAMKFKTDSAKPLVIVWFGLRLTDVITDINICYVLWFDYIQYQRDNYFLLVLCVLCTLFLIIPWAFNVSAIYKVKLYFAKNRRSSLWFTTPINIKFFLFLVLITGDVFFATEFISSYIFGIRRLDAGISAAIDIAQLRKFKVFGVICLENLPQMIIAATYFVAIAHENVSVLTIAILSMALSALSIFVYVTSWCFTKISTNHEIIQYSVHLNAKQSHIPTMMKKVGFKRELRANLCTILGEEDAQMEVVYISPDGCSIFVVHLVHQNDLRKKAVSSYINQKYKKHHKAIVKMFKTYYGLEERQKIDFEIRFDQEIEPNTKGETVVVCSDSEAKELKQKQSKPTPSKSKTSKRKASNAKAPKRKESKQKESKSKASKKSKSKPKPSK